MFTHQKEGEHTQFINFILNGPPNKNITERKYKKGSKFCLKAKSSDKNLGCFDTKKQRDKRERDIQYFKHMTENVLEEVFREVIRDILK